VSSTLYSLASEVKLFRVSCLNTAAPHPPVQSSPPSTSQLSTSRQYFALNHQSVSNGFILLKAIVLLYCQAPTCIKKHQVGDPTTRTTSRTKYCALCQPISARLTSTNAPSYDHRRDRLIDHLATLTRNEYSQNSVSCFKSKLYLETSPPRFWEQLDISLPSHPRLSQHHLHWHHLITYCHPTSCCLSKKPSNFPSDESIGPH